MSKHKKCRSSCNRSRLIMKSYLCRWIRHQCNLLCTCTCVHSVYLCTWRVNYSRRCYMHIYQQLYTQSKTQNCIFWMCSNGFTGCAKSSRTSCVLMATTRFTTGEFWPPKYRKSSTNCQCFAQLITFTSIVPAYWYAFWRIIFGATPFMGHLLEMSKDEIKRRRADQSKSDHVLKFTGSSTNSPISNKANFGIERQTKWLIFIINFNLV